MIPTYSARGSKPVQNGLGEYVVGRERLELSTFCVSGIPLRNIQEALGQNSFPILCFWP